MAPIRKSKRSKRSKSRSRPRPRPRTRKWKCKMIRKQSRRKRMRSKSMKVGRDYDQVVYNNNKYYYKSKPIIPEFIAGKPKYVEINQIEVPKLLKNYKYTEITNSESNYNAIKSRVSKELSNSGITPSNDFKIYNNKYMKKSGGAQPEPEINLSEYIFVDVNDTNYVYNDSNLQESNYIKLGTEVPIDMIHNIHNKLNDETNHNLDITAIYNRYSKPT